MDQTVGVQFPGIPEVFRVRAMPVGDGLQLRPDPGNVPIDLLHIQRLVPGFPIVVHPDGQIPGIAAVQAVLLAKVQAAGGGDHHQHHGQQHADGCQPRAVALHAVGHGGSGYKMLRPVVVAPVFLQQPAQQHGAGNQQQIGGNDDHDHRHKEPGHSLQRVLDGHRQIVGAAQNHNAQQRQQPVAPGGLFSHIFAAEQLHGLRKLNLAQSVQEDQQVNDAEQQQGILRRVPGHEEVQADLRADHVGKPQLRQLGQGNAEAQTEHPGHQPGHHRLPEQDPRDAPLAHAQDVVKSKFLFPPADQEGIGVKQKQHGKHRDDEAAQPQNGAQDGVPADLLHLGRNRKGIEDVEHGGGHHAGEQVRKVQPPVFADTVCRQPGKQEFRHARSPPCASIVRVSEIF